MQRDRAERMICPICKKENADDWLLDVNGKLESGCCQDCWEQETDIKWWNMFRSKLPLLNPILKNTEDK